MDLMPQTKNTCERIRLFFACKILILKSFHSHHMDVQKSNSTKSCTKWIEKNLKLWSLTLFVALRYCCFYIVEISTWFVQAKNSGHLSGTFSIINSRQSKSHNNFKAFFLSSVACSTRID